MTVKISTFFAIHQFILQPHFEKFFKFFIQNFLPKIQFDSKIFSLLGSFGYVFNHDIDFTMT